MLKRLKAKAKYLRDLDSGSGVAAEIEWAIEKIERMRDGLRDIYRNDMLADAEELSLFARDVVRCLEK